tara:strand:- start:361 stop:903 length:543 start_codon:yes stop_codon:yes gene_type:complete
MDHEQFSELANNIAEVEAANDYTFALEDIQRKKALLILTATANNDGNHVSQVSSQVSWLGHEFEMVALLHDSIENTPKKSIRKKLKQLILRNFGEMGDKIFDAVIAITKRPHQDYFVDYLPQVASNPIALQVKIADMKHNLKRSQGGQPSPQRDGRRAKYMNGLKFLGKMLANRYHMEEN